MKSSTTFSVRNDRPQASVSAVKSTDQRSFGRLGAAAGSRRAPDMRFRRFRRTARPSAR